jgi:hypothetical protein
MIRTVKISAAAILLSAVAQTAMAENRVPDELRATITPAYRTGDMSSSSDTRYVLVKRIEGSDSAGNRHVLFNDRQGALLPVVELARAGMLINPVGIEQKGDYHDLQLQLDDRALALGEHGMKGEQLPDNLATQMALNGKIAVHKYEVAAAGLSLRQTQGQLGKVAMR